MVNMPTSRVPDTIDALIQRFTEAGLTVFDGPVVTGDYSAAVFVGYDAGGEDSEFRSATTAQEWASLGAKARNEEFSIGCAVAAIDGGGGTKAARDAVYALLGTIGTTLRADPSLGQPPPFVAELASGDLFSEPTTSGVQCRLPFVIHVKTRV